MLRAAEFILISAAVLAFNAGPLPAVSTTGGWPAFRDIGTGAARDITVPAAGLPDNTEFRDPISTAAASVYTFDLPVENPAGLQSPIRAADKTQNLSVTVVRKGYGSYEAEMEISGGTATFKVLQISSGGYLVRSGDVNLIAAPGASGAYYDVSGNIPTPAGETIKFRLNLRPDKALGAEEHGYKFTLSRERATGEIDTSLFSRADAACMIALGMAIHADSSAAPDPSWTPYVPGPWIHIPYTPGPGSNNPWYAQNANNSGGGGSIYIGGGAGRKSAKAKSAAKGGGGGGGGVSFGGGGGGRRRSSGRGGSGAGGWGGGRRGGRGQQGSFYDDGDGGGRGGGRQRSSGGRNGGKSGGAVRPRKAAPPSGGGRGGAGRPKAAGSGPGGRAGRKPAYIVRKNTGTQSPAHNTGVGPFNPRPLTAKAGGGAQKKPAADSPKSAQQPAPQQKKSPAAANTFRQVWFGGSRGWHNAAAHPPAFRDSLNDGDGRAQPAYAAFGAPRGGGSRALASVVARGRRVIAAVAENLAKAVDSWRAAMAALWTWLKTLV